MIAENDILKTHGVARSPHWSMVRHHWLLKNPKCAHCGGIIHVEVHHCVPFHIHPELELDDTNFISLCEVPGSECHLKIGHLGNWKNFNPHVREDCKAHGK